VGAVLVQQTAWNNAARAVTQIKEAGCLDSSRLLSLSRSRLEALIRPSGFFRVKSRRLRGLACFVDHAGGIGKLGSWSTEILREGLLAVKGIGPETADAILLYAFKRPVFVVDAYARRLFGRLHCPEPVPRDEELKAGIESILRDVQLLNELHALIVEHGKRCCGSAPACERCCLQALCGRSQRAATVSHSLSQL